MSKINCHNTCNNKQSSRSSKVLSLTCVCPFLTCQQLSSSPTEMGKIWPMGQIWSSKRFYLAYGGSLSPTRPRSGGQPGPRCMRLVPTTPRGAVELVWCSNWIPLPGSLSGGSLSRLPCTHYQGYWIEWADGVSLEIGPGSVWAGMLSQAEEMGR